MREVVPKLGLSTTREKRLGHFTGEIATEVVSCRTQGGALRMFRSVRCESVVGRGLKEGRKSQSACLFWKLCVTIV
jgi:hypothetical protein